MPFKRWISRLFSNNKEPFLFFKFNNNLIIGFLFWIAIILSINAYLLFKINQRTNQEISISHVDSLQIIKLQNRIDSISIAYEKRQKKYFSKNYYYSNNYQNKNSKFKENQNTTPKHNLKPFDPNKLSVNGFMELGFSEKQASSIIKYRNALKGFKSKEQFRKSYVVSDFMYQKLEPYISITNENLDSRKIFEKEKVEIQGPEKEKFNYQIVELNTASIEEIQEKLNIRKGLATGIVKYRNLLGGYYSKDQLSEVYYMDDKTLEVLKKYGTIDSINIKRFDVNTCEYKEILRHPYFTKPMVEMLFNLRRSGLIVYDINEIRKFSPFDTIDFSKIAVYLTITK